MADAVQRRLEAMVPELHYCLKRRLLTRHEVTALVRQRRAFEYRLHRRNVTKLDYLRYIRAELLVEELLRLREGAGRGGKAGKARYGALRRVVRLLWALITRWGFEEATARTALHIAAAVPNRRLLARLYARLLQLHPHDVALWREAAQYEFTAGGNVRSARALFQRALRHNAAATPLWAAYHRLEATHWQLATDARAAADAAPTMDAAAAAAALEELISAFARGAPAPDDDAAAVPFSALAVPRRVAAEALRRTRSPATLRALLEVYADFAPHALAPALALLRAAYALSAECADTDDARAEWAAALAEAPALLALGGEPARAADLAAQTFEAAGVRFGLSSALLLAQLRVYGTTLAAHTAAAGGVPRVLYQKLFAQCAALDPRRLHPDLLRHWLAFARSAPTPADATAIARAVCAAAPDDGGVWCAALAVLTAAAAPVADVLHAALAAALPSPALAAFALSALASGLAPLPPSADRLAALLVPHVAAAPAAPLLRSLLGLFALHYDLAAARRVADALLQRAPSADAVLVCVALEGRPGARPDAAADQRVTALLERALAARPGPGPADAPRLWAALVQHLLSGRQAAPAQAAAWRARHALRGPALAAFERLVSSA